MLPKVIVVSTINLRKSRQCSALWDLGFRVLGFGIRVSGLGFRVYGLRFRVYSLGTRM